MNTKCLFLYPIAFIALTVVPAMAQQAAPAKQPAPDTSEGKSDTDTAPEAPATTPPDYLDDRSTPEALVRSYYNAINREEYARAYSYYAADNVPSPFPQFQAGYENTASVEVSLGKVESEGAAGSTYWSQPLAIKSTLKNGSTEVYNGCYRLRLAQPAIQGVPYMPMSILDGRLQKSEKSLAESVPEGCEAP